MRKAYLVGTAVLAVGFIAAYPNPRAQKALVAKGEYVVTRASMCIDCHTPMLPDGRPDDTRKLGGAPIGFKPNVEIPNWETAAPNLTPAGFLKDWTDSQLVTFLRTGKDPHGHLAHPPMPAYRLNPADAQAVTAYLRSMPPVQPGS